MRKRYQWKGMTVMELQEVDATSSRVAASENLIDDLELTN